MKGKKAIALILIAVMILAVLLTSCGGSKASNLEEYVSGDEELKAELDKIANDNGLAIDVTENLMIFTYTYPEKFDEAMKEQAGPLIEQALASYESTFQGLAKDLEESTGLSGVTIKVQYLDADATELYSAQYTSAGVVAE